MRKILGAIIHLIMSLIAGAVAAFSMTATVIDPEAEKVVDASGNLRVWPGDYLQPHTSLLGTNWAVAADQGPGAKQILTVYESPGTTAASPQERGFCRWFLLCWVKEVFSAATDAMTTGTVSRAQTTNGLVRLGQGQ